MDPRRVPDEAQLAANQKSLAEGVEWVLESCLSQPRLFPNDLRFIYGAVCADMRFRFSDADSHQLVGSFVFLRLVCPAIITPEPYGISLAARPAARRDLIQIAKVIQSLANQAELGEKEPWLKPLAHLSATWTPRLTHFLSSLSVEGSARAVEGGTTFDTDVQSGYALVNYSLCKNINRLIEQSQHRFVQPKELTSTERLKLRFRAVNADGDQLSLMSRLGKDIESGVRLASPRNPESPTTPRERARLGSAHTRQLSSLIETGHMSREVSGSFSPGMGSRESSRDFLSAQNIAQSAFAFNEGDKIETVSYESSAELLEKLKSTLATC